VDMGKWGVVVGVFSGGFCNGGGWGGVGGGEGVGVVLESNKKVTHVPLYQR